MKTMILFKSKYGSSRQYAAWIADALQCRVEDAGLVKLDELLANDVIIYVGGIYAGGVNGYKSIQKHLGVLQHKKLILCMVGMADPAERGPYEEVFSRNVPEPYRNAVKPFALRGDQLFSKMNPFHRLIMNVPKAAVKKIPEEQRTEGQKNLLKNFGKDIRFVKQDSISEVVAYAKKLSV